MLGNGNETYAVTELDDDLQITFDDSGEILVIGGATLPSLNIVGEEVVDDDEPQLRLIGNTAIYGTATEEIFRISGVTSLDGIFLDELDDGVITIAQSSLGASTVTISDADGYRLNLDYDVDTPVASTVWTSSGTTATLKEKFTAGYVLTADNRSIVYQKEKAGNISAKLTGLKSGLHVDEYGEISGIFVDTDNQVITLDAEVLSNKTVKVTAGDYMLAPSADVDEPTQTEPVLKISGTKLTLKSSTTAGFQLSNDERSLVYTKASAGKTIAAISGLTKGLRVAADGTVDGVDVDLDTGVITLSEAALGTTTAKITGDFTLALNDDVEALEDENIWSVSGTKAEDGIIDGLEVDEDTSLIMLNSDMLSKKVSVSSASYGFAFDEEYNDAAITGSKGDDTISVAGAELTITGGKGDDYIDLSEGGGNTVVYSKGDGDDVIIGFTAEDDNLKIKGGGTLKVETENRNVIIAVGTGTIILEDAAGQDISINGKLYSTADVSGSNGYWFADDTNFIGETNLDAISAENYAVTNIESVRVENLVMNDSLISALTFATE